MSTLAAQLDPWRNPDIKMSRDQHFTRVDLVDIKLLIAKKLGSQKAERYFNLINRFFTQKITKTEFDKLCIVTIGRDNLTLHNHFIRSIAQNACLSQTPPTKPSKHDTSANGKSANGYQRSCLQSLCRDMFPQSPRRGRTPGFPDRKLKDRPSPLGPHGKPQTLTCEELRSTPKTLEQQSATELHSLGSRPVEINSVEDGEEVDQIRSRRSPVTAPLGVQIIHTKGTRKMLTSSRTCYDDGELPKASSLRKRMEQRLEAEGLKVTLDCVNLLNNGLDAYLKRLIRPCLEMANSRVGSLLDFQAAIELNPASLGEDWPHQLEKISLQQNLIVYNGGSDGLDEVEGGWII
ncbi:hypothetical protein V2J09_009861 [Rumex salicifolius]